MVNWSVKPDVAALLSKDFVYVKIDLDRMAGAKPILEKFNSTGEGGIPWFAFLSSDGKSIADSNAPAPKGRPNLGGNIGFPAKPEEIAHFVSMLKKAKQHLTDADIAALQTSLENDKKSAR